MAIARRGSQVAHTFSSAAVASISSSLPAAATPGDAVIVGASDFPDTGSPPPSGLSDNQGNTYTRDAIGAGLNTTDRDRGALYSALGIAANAGTFTVTFTPAASSVCGVILCEYDPGQGRTLAVDVTASSGSDTPATAQDSGTTAATAQADEVAVAYRAGEGVGSITTSAPFNEVAQDATSILSVMSDRITSAPGAQQCQWTTLSTRWDACVVAYKSAPAGPPQGPVGAS